MTSFATTSRCLSILRTHSVHFLWAILLLVVFTRSAASQTINSVEIVLPQLGTITPGDTACGWVVIRNISPRSITLSGIGVEAFPNWQCTGIPQMPMVLIPHDSLLFHACCAPGQSDWGSSTMMTVRVNFIDSAGDSLHAIAEAMAQVTQCSTPVIDTLYMGDVMLGGYTEGEMRFVVHGPIIYNGVFGGLSETPDYQPDTAGSITILAPTLPIATQPGDTVDVRFRIAPSHTGTFEATIGLRDTALGPCELIVDAKLRAVDSSSDTLHLFPDQTDLLTLYGTSSHTSRTFYFYNNSGSNQIITAAVLSSGAHFHIVGCDPHAPADTLAPNGRLGITIEFDADSTGFYRDSLTIVTKNGLQPEAFAIQAIRSGGTTADVRHGNADVPLLLTLTPNPAVSNVSIAVAGAQTAMVEIFDLLGRRVWATQNATVPFIWHVTTSGVYIVRASGTDMQGRPFVRSNSLQALP